MPRPRLSIGEFSLLLLIVIGLSGFASGQTTKLPDAVNGAAYSLELHFLAVAPINASVSAGALLGGRRLSGKVLVSGTPVISGNADFNFTVTATDSSLPPQILTSDYHMRGLTALGAPAGSVACLSDGRGVLDASFYVGPAVDTFAASDTLKYLNPGASGNLQERAIGGFNFGYRLAGDPHIGPGKKWTNNLWIYGETVYRVRSADVNCTQNPDLAGWQQQPGCRFEPGAAALLHLAERNQPGGLHGAAL